MKVNASQFLCLFEDFPLSTMKIVQLNVKYCCFCIELRTGVLVLGWLGVICGTVNFFKTLNDIVYFNENKSSLHQVLQPDAEPGKLDEFLSENRSVQLTVFILWLCAYGLVDTSSIFLIIGVYKEKAVFILQYLVSMIVTLVLGLISQILMSSILPEENRMATVTILVVANCLTFGKLKRRKCINFLSFIFL